MYKKIHLIFDRYKVCSTLCFLKCMSVCEREKEKIQIVRVLGVLGVKYFDTVVFRTSGLLYQSSITIKVIHFWNNVHEMMISVLLNNPGR